MEENKSASESIIEKAKISEQNSSSSFMEPEIKETKKKPGRPKKAESIKKDSTEKSESKQDPAFNIPTKIICYPLVKGISVVGYNYVKHPQAALTSQEIDDMAQALAMVIDKYAPEALNKYGPEIMLATSLGTYGLRLYALKKALLEKEAKAKPQENVQPRPSENVDYSGLEKSQEVSVI